MKQLSWLLLLFGFCAVGFVYWGKLSDDQRAHFTTQWLAFIGSLQKQAQKPFEKPGEENKPGLIPSIQFGGGEFMPPELHIYSCVKQDTKRIDEVQKTTQVYRWVDVEGKVHFGDRPTDNATDLSEQFKQREQYFTLNIMPQNAELPLFIKDKLTPQIKQIYTILSQDVGVDHLRQVAVNLKVFDDPEAFENYRKQEVPGLATSSGFYSALTNEAVVMHGQDDEQTLDVALHESTHVINAGLYGYTPTWFNEGTAEYFEQLEITGQSRVISAASYWHQRLQGALRAKKHMPLANYLSVEGEQWRLMDQEEMYSMAWSVIYLLMSDQSGKQTLKAMLNYMAEHFCQPFDSIAFMEKTYPGGMAELQLKWDSFIRSSHPQPHRY